MSLRILLVEDEPGLQMTLEDLLTTEGYEVETAADGESGLLKATASSYDLIILDVMLPKRNGFDLCKDLRQRGYDTAILMLTAKAQVVDRVVGLKLGADDYLAKPFDPAELLARIEALLRRQKKEGRAPVTTFGFGDVQVNFESGTAEKGGTPLALAGKELQLLRYLVERRGKIVMREELLQNVWEYRGDINSRTIDVHIAWLRQKLEENPQTPKYIHTIRGKGYRFSG